MKHLKFSFLAFAALLLVSACNNKTKVNEYTVDVNVSGLDGNNDVFMQELTDNGYAITDTAVLTDKGYVFHGSVEKPKLVYLTSKSFGRGAIPLFLEASKIKINGSLDSLAKAEVSGSKAHDFFAEINHKLAEYDKIWQDFYLGPYRKMSKIDQAANEDKINMLFDSAQNMKARYLEAILRDNGKQPATPVLALNNVDAMDVDAAQAIYDNLSPENMETRSAKDLADRISILKRTAIGQPLIDFTMNDTEGKPVSLSDYAKDKYVLVDFWAAWCAPCRGENPNVVANYNKYHDKGFTVFGVSFDQKKENWLQAIKDDGLVWGQVSDLQGWGNAAGKLYGIRSIPQNILLDPNGIIIAKNLRGPALGEKLNELLGSK